MTYNDKGIFYQVNKLSAITVQIYIPLYLLELILISTYYDYHQIRLVKSELISNHDSDTAFHSVGLHLHRRPYVWYWFGRHGYDRAASPDFHF